MDGNQSISNRELGDLIESMDYFTRNYCESNATANHDWPGPMNQRQAMESLHRLVKEYHHMYSMAYLTVPNVLAGNAFRNALYSFLRRVIHI